MRRIALICAFLISSVFLLSAANAQKSPEKTLRWAADTLSGAPYVFYPAHAPDKMTGFEYDIVMKLAEEMNAKPVFVQNAWDSLILGLGRNEYDIAINGIEITDERKQEVLFSDIYYQTSLLLTIRAIDQKYEHFQTLSDLKGLKVGTLGGALSEKMLRDEGGIDVVIYDSEANAHQDLLTGRIEVLLFDAPISKYYSEVDSRFKVLKAPIGLLLYGIPIAKKNAALQKEINAALNQLKKSGELRKILERWDLWNPSMAFLLQDDAPSRGVPVEFENYKKQFKNEITWSDRLAIYKKVGPLLLRGAGLTLKISFLAMIVAIGFGLLIVTLRLYAPRPLSALTVVWIELVRGTPLLLQLFFIFYALPHLGIELSPLWAGVLGLGLNYAVQEAEIYRAGLSSVHHNQVEAARMLGLSGSQTFFHVQIPQALRVSLPAMTTDFIALIKDSSLVSVITLVELTKVYTTLASTYFDYIGLGLFAGFLYLLMGLPLSVLARFLERKLTISSVQHETVSN